MLCAPLYACVCVIRGSGTDAHLSFKTNNISCNVSWHVSFYLKFRNQTSRAGLLGLLFEPEDGGSTFMRNAAELQPHYSASHPVGQYCASPLPCSGNWGKVRKFNRTVFCT
jgi:hypothetical protein